MKSYLTKICFALFIIAIGTFGCQKNEVALECVIVNLAADLGECNEDGSYRITINFTALNTENEKFDVFVRNNVLIGTYNLTDLPLTIPNFNPSGLEYDYLRVCMNDNQECCQEIEFMPPECESDECSIFDVVTTIGECTSENTYNLTIDFEVNNPGNDYFELWSRNQIYIGYYLLSDLPLTLENFEMSGFDYDYLNICINDVPDCCHEIEFMPPDCNGTGGDCEIFDVVMTIGECTSENTYNLTLDFEVNNPGNDYFELWSRNQIYIGYYLLSDLPLTLENFEMSGFDYDYLNICINDVPDCCHEIEFMPPECNGTGGDCEIFDLTTVIGDCVSTEAYTLTIDFEVNNPGNIFFEVYVRNNVLLDYYPLSDLPLTIESFELSGFDYDFIQVCINDVPDCCVEHEFMPPDC